MTSRTHDLAAFTAINTVVVTQTLPTMTIGTALSAVFSCFIGGLAPDLDKPTSEFWQKFPIGHILGRLFHKFAGKHRHLSHSLLGFILIGVLTRYLFNLIGRTILVDMQIVWIAFMIGYFSHLLADSLTKDGIPLLFPLPINFGFPPFKFLRIKTGGKIEKYLIFPGLLLFNLYLFANFYPQYTQLIKSLIK